MTPKKKVGYAIVFTISEMKEFLNKRGFNFTINPEEDYGAKTEAEKERDELIFDIFDGEIKKKLFE